MGAIFWTRTLPPHITAGPFPRFGSQLTRRLRLRRRPPPRRRWYRFQSRAPGRELDGMEVKMEEKEGKRGGGLKCAMSLLPPLRSPSVSHRERGYLQSGSAGLD